MIIYFAGETVVREYTPIVNPVDKDSKHLMLMIKIYSHGKMTQYLSTIHAGKFYYCLLIPCVSQPTQLILINFVSKYRGGIIIYRCTLAELLIWTEKSYTGIFIQTVQIRTQEYF